MIKQRKEKKIKKILIIGHFGGNEIFLDGQTVKTKILYEELKNITNWKIKKVDTYYKNKKPIRLLFSTLFNMITTKDIIILLSGNGMKFYFPLCYIFSILFRKNIYHDVIGGNLHIYVSNYRNYKKYLNSFKVNWVETNLLKDKLNKLDINNVEVIPNFKNIHIISKDDIIINSSNNYKFCTFSRVIKEKGISDAINTLESLNKKGYNCKLDIYGPIEDNYKDEFNELIEKHKNIIKYCGVVSYNESTSTLKKYDLLLFPTYWEGEGFPGTIVDSFSSGLPVIATDWNCNKELVTSYKTGIIYPNKEEKTLEDAILKVIKDNKLYINMKYNVLKEAKKYMPNEYINKIILCIENK